MSRNVKTCKIGAKESFCPAMDGRLAQEANAKKSGFVLVVVTNGTTGKERPLGIAFKQSPNDKGLFLNCCPWCKADIEPK